MGRPFRPGIIGRDLLNLVCQTGELPYRALRVLGKSTDYTQKSVKNLVKKGYLRIEKTSIGKTILLGKNKEYLEQYLFDNAAMIHEEAVKNTYYVPDSGDTKEKRTYKKTLRTRNFRLAKATAFLHACGVYVFSDGSPYKPNLMRDKLTGTEEAFYLSNDIKQLMAIDDKKIPSRSLGCLVHGNDFYVTYYLDQTIPKTTQDTERKSKLHMEYMFGGSYLPMNRGNSRVEIKKCLLITENYPLLTRIFSIEKQRQNRYYSPNLFIVDDTYDEYYYLPFGREGIRIYKMLFKDKEKLIYLPISNKKTEITNVDCDGIDDEGNFELSFLDCEIKQLKRFLSMAEYFVERHLESKFVIYCYDFQAETLKSLVGENIKIFSFTLEQVEEAFGEEEEDAKD